MAGVDLSSINKMLKNLFESGYPTQLVIKDNPLLSMMTKRGNFTGRFAEIPVLFGHNQARSSTLAQAQAAMASGKPANDTFIVARTKDYQVFEVDNETMEATSNDAGAWVQALSLQLESSLKNFGMARAFDIYRDSVGDRGVVGSVAGAVVTLATQYDVFNFEVGMFIVGSTGSRLNALRNSGLGAQVVAVNRTAGTITLSANSDSLVAGDALFNRGDRVVGAIANSDAGLRMSGLEAWNPDHATMAATFNGVDRSVDPQRLAGINLDLSSQNPEEALMSLASECNTYGASCDKVFLNPRDFLNIKNSMGNKVVMAYSTDTKVGFDSVEIQGGRQRIHVYEDPYAPIGIGRALDMSTWTLRHTPSGLAFLTDKDGARITRTTRDSYEGQINFYGNVVCTAPGKNARVKMPV